ncbi:hypothetical protein EVAR_16074_1 [Eumeta japonica]|uniref:Uncharacterized protein n=1 Tax=Eumeta variegata TaxID=151549 RepID=A0A4C1UIB9_EUMVA|nr:hypothetical protein EVAR_16074_1 [Eumeta japonica]
MEQRDKGSCPFLPDLQSCPVSEAVRRWRCASAALPAGRELLSLQLENRLRTKETSEVSRWRVLEAIFRVWPFAGVAHARGRGALTSQVAPGRAPVPPATARPITRLTRPKSSKAGHTRTTAATGP